MPRKSLPVVPSESGNFWELRGHPDMARIVAATLQSKPKVATHWSTRTLARDQAAVVISLGTFCVHSTLTSFAFEARLCAAPHQPDANVGDCAPLLMGQFLITPWDQKMCMGNVLMLDISQRWDLRSKLGSHPRYP